MKTIEIENHHYKLVSKKKAVIYYRRGHHVVKLKETKIYPVNELLDFIVSDGPFAVYC